MKNIKVMDTVNKALANRGVCAGLGSVAGLAVGIGSTLAVEYFKKKKKAKRKAEKEAEEKAEQCPDEIEPEEEEVEEEEDLEEETSEEE